MGLEQLLREVRPGEAVSAEQWNYMVRLARRRVIGVGIHEDQNGWQVRPVSTASEPFKQFRVVRYGTDGDTLFCREWDGSNESGEGELVLLPHELRRSRYHGKNEVLYDASNNEYVTVSYVAGSHFLTRTASIVAQEYYESQIMVPQYVDRAHGGTIGPTVVVAVSRTSVAGGLGQSSDTPEEQRVKWMIVDPRAWAEVFTGGSSQNIVKRMLKRRNNSRQV